MKPLPTIRISAAGVEINGNRLSHSFSVPMISRVLGEEPTRVDEHQAYWTQFGICVLGRSQGIGESIRIFLPDIGHEIGSFMGSLDVCGIVRNDREEGSSFINRLLRDSELAFSRLPAASSHGYPLINFEAETIDASFRLTIPDHKVPQQQHECSSLLYSFSEELPKSPLKKQSDGIQSTNAQSQPPKEAQPLSQTTVVVKEGGYFDEAKRESARIHTRWFWGRGWIWVAVFVIVVLLLSVILIAGSR